MGGGQEMVDRCRFLQNFDLYGKWVVGTWELIKLFLQLLLCLNFYTIKDQHLMCFCSGKDPKIQAVSESSMINKEQLYHQLDHASVKQ